MVGGDAAQVERARPIFSIVGEEMFHMGAVGMGQAAKLCNNLMSLINMKVVEEGLALARAAGIDEDRMIEIAKVSTGDSWALRGIKP
ncbi:MAG: NAD-binding protein, partial [Alphaproteobacteria bacterium]